MNIQLALYSILSLFFALFGTGHSEHLNPKVYENKKVISESEVNNKFNKLLDHYYAFYENKAKHVSIKMGDKSYIKQFVNADFTEDLIEVSYEESLNLCSDTLKMNVSLVDLYFYNRKRTSYQKLSPEEIKPGSSKARLVERHLAKIRKKSEKLFASAVKVVTEPQPSQAYQR